MPAPELSAAFAALGDPTRLGLVERLLAEGERTAGELCQGVGISAPAVSRHLKVLREAGLVRRRIDGQRRIYAADPGTLGIIGHWALAHRCFWETGLDRLDAALRRED